MLQMIRLHVHSKNLQKKCVGVHETRRRWWRKPHLLVKHGVVKRVVVVATTLVCERIVIVVCFEWIVAHRGQGLTCEARLAVSGKFSRSASVPFFSNTVHTIMLRLRLLTS